MSGFYVWTQEELGLDVQEMDREHQILIDHMNALYDAVEAKSEASQIETLVDNLVQYTKKHFADEEAYMEKIQFSGLATHKIIHQQLLKQLNEYVESYKNSREITQSFFNFLKVWLTSHIRGIDMKYSDFHHGKKAS